jgi:type I restriction enzyme S subunit
MKRLTDMCNITTGKLDSNAFEIDGKYPFFTCAPSPLRINSYAFEDDVILLAGNNASGNFHCQRYSGKFNAYQRTYVITEKEGYDLDYIFYNLKILN